MGPVGVALELVGVGKGLFADGAAVFVVGFPVVRAEQVGGVKSEGGTWGSPAERRSGNPTRNTKKSLK